MTHKTVQVQVTGACVLTKLPLPRYASPVKTQGLLRVGGIVVGIDKDSVVPDSSRNLPNIYVTRSHSNQFKIWALKFSKKNPRIALKN